MPTFQKFAAIAVLALASLTLAETETSSIDFDLPNRVDAFRVPSLGNEFVEVYENADKTQFFYQPLLLPDWSRYKDNVDTVCEDVASNELAIAILPIQLTSQEVEQDIVRLLHERGRADALSVSPLPHTIYQIFANLGTKTIVINDSDLPALNSGIGLQIKTSMPSIENYEIEATCAELNRLYQRRAVSGAVSGRLFAQGFAFSSDYIYASASFANNQQIRSELFGDEVFETTTDVTNSSSGGGFSVNLGLFKFGGGGGSTQTSTTTSQQRVVSRDYMNEIITRYSAQLDLRVRGNPERTRETVNQFTSILLGYFDAVELSIVRESETLWRLMEGQVTYANLGELEIKEILESKPELNNEVESERQASIGGRKGASGRSPDKGNFTYKNDVKWEFDGERWIPTKVDLFMVSESDLNKQIQFQAYFFNDDGKRATTSPFLYPANWLVNRQDEFGNNPSLDLPSLTNTLGTLLSDNQRIVVGATEKGNTNWQQHGDDPYSIVTCVDLSNYNFESTPYILTSLGGHGRHWVTKGTSSVYPMYKDGKFTEFCMYLNYIGNVEPDTANEWGWYINYIIIGK